MTKERLEELIEQKATIWDDADHFEIKLNPEQCSITEVFGETVLWYQPKDEPSGYDWSWELDVLREDVDRAKWEHDMYAERTERFEPPMWEEIENGVKDGYTFCFIGKDGYFYCFCVEKERINKIYMNYEMRVDNKVFEDMEATKENYEKACEMVRDLFRGTKK